MGPVLGDRDSVTRVASLTRFPGSALPLCMTSLLPSIALPQRLRKADPRKGSEEIFSSLFLVRFGETFLNERKYTKCVLQCLQIMISPLWGMFSFIYESPLLMPDAALT